VTTRFETPRLLLREMTEADADHFVALGANPRVLRYIAGEPPVTTREEALTVLRERVFPQYARGLGRLACIEKRGGDFLGWCGLKHRPETDEIDLGYRFLEAHWGRGYATEAAGVVCAFAREHLRGRRIVGTAMLENGASRRVLEKVGLVFEREVVEEGCTVAVYVLP
jgi:ribosomal-protein-alanine N-acetyltransferase